MLEMDDSRFNPDINTRRPSVRFYAQSSDSDVEIQAQRRHQSAMYVPYIPVQNYSVRDQIPMQQSSRRRNFDTMTEMENFRGRAVAFLVAHATPVMPIEVEHQLDRALPFIPVGSTSNRATPFIPVRPADHAGSGDIWERYNSVAKRVDSEWIKGWTASLNSLLVFASIFAAVLTAFLIESKKMLEQDQTQLLVNIAMWNTNNRGNTSSVPYSPPDFEVTSESIVINCLLFASLGASLVAALASVLALQWVADYEAAINRGASTPIRRAQKRQARYEGVTAWKMYEIIAALPLLLHFSVALFWAAAIQWMWSLHHAVGYIVAGGAILSVIFYFLTTLLGACFVSAPFKTPLSLELYWILQPIINSIRIPLSVYTKQWFRAVFQSLPFFRENDRPTNPPRPVGSTIGHAPRDKESSLLDNKVLQSSLQSTSTDMLPMADTEPAARTEFHNYQPDSSVMFDEISDNLKGALFKSRYEERWVLTIENFSNNYLQKVLCPTFLDEDYEYLGALMLLIERLRIQQRLYGTMSYVQDPTEPVYWSQCCFEVDSPGVTPLLSSETMSLLLSRDVPIPSIRSEDEIMATVRLIRWRNTVGLKTPDILIDILASRESYSREYFRSCRELFARFISQPLEDEQFGLLTSGDTEKIWDQITRIIKVVSYLMQGEISGHLHEILSRFFSRGVMLASQKGLPECPAQVYQIVAEVLDPCIASILGFACEIPVFVESKLTKSYQEKYYLSIVNIQSLLYKPMSIEDSKALWKLRAATFSVQGPIISDLTWVQALRVPTSLIFLQHIFAHEMPCYGHSQGPHHLLFHMYLRMPPLGVFHPDMVVLGDLDINPMYLNPIILLIAQPEPVHFSSLVRQGLIHEQCLNTLVKMIKEVKRHPACIYALLTDIALTASGSGLKGMALILECVEQAATSENVDSSLNLLRSLAYAIKNLSQITLMQSSEVEAEFGERVSAHANRLSRLLYTRSISYNIASPSHLKMVSCVRTNASTRLATNWHAMYLGI